jgi:hypothetical protein
VDREIKNKKKEICIMKELVLEIIEKLEIIRKHRVEERGLLTKLLEDEVILAINNLTNVLAENYL